MVIVPRSFSTTKHVSLPGRWRTIGVSERAPKRTDANLPNEDAIGCEVSDDGRAFFLAVADGHGSEAYFRSHLGSQFAVEAAWHAAMRYQSGQFCFDQLPLQLENYWRQMVVEHYFAAELTADELQIAKPLNIYEPYGTTLLFVVAKQNHLAAVRFGDGDIVSVTRDGMALPIFPLSDKSSATNILAQPNSYLNAEVTTRLLDPGAMPFLMASTDGLSDGCASDSDFMSIVEQLNLMTRRHCTDSLEAELRHLLGRVNGIADGHGSNDDATLALAFQEK